MIEIIPAIDIMSGRCVRLTQGDFLQKKVYGHDPLAIAMEYESIGIKRLHLVDLDGARAGTIKNLETLSKIAAGTSLIIDYGGGIRTGKDAQAIFDAGAAMINVSSIAIKEPSTLEEWIGKYGADRILLGADVNNELVAISGWQDETAVNVFAFIQDNIGRGIGHFFCTDISTDGMLGGPSLELYSRIMVQFPEIDLIASGGVSGFSDVLKLRDIGCKGVIIGKAIYEGRISLNEIKDHIADGTN